MASASQRLLQSTSGGGNISGIGASRRGSASSNLLNSVQTGTYQPKQYVTPARLDSKPQPKTQPEQTVPQKITKNVARFGVNFASMVTSGLNFAANFLGNNPIFIGPGERISSAITEKITGKPDVLLKAKEFQRNKWRDFYNEKLEAGEIPTDRLNEYVERIQQSEYLEPTKEYQKASFKDKILKHPGETLATLGTSGIPSMVAMIVGGPVGIFIVATSTMNDIQQSALENGVSRDDSEVLALGAGTLIMALEAIVPDELMSRSQKKVLLNGLIKRVMTTGAKEALTEIVQEDIQLATEATFREDLGMDEVIYRNIMAGLGGLLLGSGADLIVGTVNSYNQDILEGGTITEELPQAPLPSPTVEVAPTQAQKVTTPSTKVAKAKPKGKPSKVGLSIEAKAIEKGLTQSFEGTAEFTPITIKRQAKLMAELISSDVERAKRVVLGQEAIPDGMRAGTVLKAMEDYAMSKGDVDLLRGIASSPLTSETSLHAQELRLLAERNPDSPVKLMREIVDVRKKAFADKRKGQTTSEATKKVASDIKSKVKITSKGEWNSFIKSITC